MARKSSNRSFNSFALFLQFLSSRKLFRKFVLELDRQNFTDDFLSIINRINPECYLICAFSWDDALEGYDFWSQVDTDWSATFRPRSSSNKSK